MQSFNQISFCFLFQVSIELMSPPHPSFFSYKEATLKKTSRDCIKVIIVKNERKEKITKEGKCI